MLKSRRIEANLSVEIEKALTACTSRPLCNPEYRKLGDGVIGD